MIYGPTRLSGNIAVSGAKNAALPILAASLLATGRSRISRVPDLKDIITIIKLLENLGVKIEQKEDVLTIDSNSIHHFEAPYELVKTMRASVLVLGPLLTRFQKAKVSLPGGCAIGARPINLHLAGLAKMGAEICLENGYVVAEATRLRGATIYFDTVTVTGTQNLMMAAALAEGTTILENAAREPEIIDVAHYLNKMGAKITGAGTDTIFIEGVKELHGTDYEVMPDRIETGTILIAVAVAGGNVTIQNCIPTHVEALIERIVSSDIKIETSENSMRVVSTGRIEKMKLQTQPYPGFPTDLQAQMMVLLTQAEGTSFIAENIFENRYNHVAELCRMGATISVDGKMAVIEGKTILSGAPVMATDLRASACLVIAGLIAEGKTEISRIYHLDRGYEKLHEKLLKLGARIERMVE